MHLITKTVTALYVVSFGGSSPHIVEVNRLVDATRSDQGRIEHINVIGGHDDHTARRIHHSIEDTEETLRGSGSGKETEGNGRIPESCPFSAREQKKGSGISRLHEFKRVKTINENRSLGPAVLLSVFGITRINLGAS